MELKKTTRLLAIAAALLLLSNGVSAAPKLMQGPMLGVVNHNSAKIWARVGGEYELSIRYSESPKFENAITTKAIKASPENDYCVETTLNHLKYGSFYYYQVLLDGQPLQAPGERDGYPILTAPAPESLVKFTIAFGSGAKADTDGLQAIWLQVQNARPHAFFWVGENESLLDLSPSLQAEQYRKQRDVPFLQPLLRSIPQLATWDAPASMEDQRSTMESLDVFKRYWANPGYGTAEAPGSYFIYNYGGVDFYFLDTFTYRDEKEDQTLLGQKQLEWLQKGLAESEAQFKVLLSGSSWTNETSGNKNSWVAYQSEREKLFDFIKAEKINGVVLVSGDDDEAEIKAIPMSRKGGYDLYEFVSSPLAQEPESDYREDSESVISIEEPYADSMNFGMMTFDMSENDALISFEIINVFGESVFPTFELRASELANGIISWKEKVSSDSIAYIEAELDAVN